MEEEMKEGYFVFFFVGAVEVDKGSGFEGEEEEEENYDSVFRKYDEKW